MSSIESSDSALEPFFNKNWISEVIGELKSGKEATVFVCRATEKRGGGLVAAKVYKEQSRRSFKNDAVYQAGRVIVNSRAKRAFENKSEFGREVQSYLWINEEWKALRLFHDEGISVPKPLMRSDNALLMEFIGDDAGPAPQLKDAKIPREIAERVCDQALWEVREMLACCAVHGDLSAYNTLYWKERIVVIDLPQVIDPRFNPHARDLLLRDVENICNAFARFGVKRNPQVITNRLWRAFKHDELD